MKKNRVAVVLCSVCVLLVLAVLPLTAGCAKQETSTAPIKIGALLPFTGSMSAGGTPMRQGIELALDTVGSQVGGRQIQVIIEDDASDPVTAVDKAKKMVEADKVAAVLGPLAGNEALAVAAYIGKTGVPWLAVYDNSLSIMALGKNIYQYSGTTLVVGYYTGIVAYDMKGYRTATIIGSDYVAGDEYTQGFIDGFTSRGGTIVQRQKSPLGTMDYGPFIMGLKKADVVGMWMPPLDAARFVKQYYTFGLRMPIAISNAPSLADPTLADIGDSSIGIIGGAHWAASINTETNRKFLEAYQKKYGGTPIAHVMYIYPPMLLLLDALRLTKDDTSPDKLNAALFKANVDTPLGKLSFGPDRMGVLNSYVLEVIKKDNRLTWGVIKTYDQVPGKAPSEK